MASTDLEIRGVCDATLDSVPDELTAGTVHLWLRPLLASPDAIEVCHELLLPEERERAARFRVERPRGDYILTRGTLRCLISKYLHTAPQEITFQYTNYGKPFVPGSDLQFNVSHTDGLALLAFVMRRDIGVDVEKVRPQTDVRQLAERFFSVHERNALRDLTGDDLHEAFFRCWTRKEAYIKAKGEGLSLPLHQFDVSIERNPKQALISTRPDATEANRWAIQNVTVPHGYAAAVAIAIQT
jgi:4'-phosphopantetheinyl transferase